MTFKLQQNCLTSFKGAAYTSAFACGGRAHLHGALLRSTLVISDAQICPFDQLLPVLTQLILGK